MQDFDQFIYSKQPGYDEPATRKAFSKAVPLRAVLVYCFDPRAVGIPQAVAREFGEVFPGDIIYDAYGRKVASTATLFEVIVAGGRAFDALRSVTVAQHLFGIERIIIVHHTFCGATTFTPEGIIKSHKKEHDRDISDIYPRDSICISDFNASLAYDVKLMRNASGTPPHVSIYGCLYDIDNGKLIQVVSDIVQNNQL